MLHLPNKQTKIFLYVVVSFSKYFYLSLVFIDQKSMIGSWFLFPMTPYPIQTKNS